MYVPFFLILLDSSLLEIAEHYPKLGYLRQVIKGMLKTTLSQRFSAKEVVEQLQKVRVLGDTIQSNFLITFKFSYKRIKKYNGYNL